MGSVARSLALFALVACGKHDAEPVDPEISGTFIVDDKPMAVSDCHPSAGPEGAAVQITMRTGGRLRFRDAKMDFQFKSTRWEPMACERLRSTGGGAVGADGRASWRGTLDFRCKWLDVVMDGKLTLDCGTKPAESLK